MTRRLLRLDTAESTNDVAAGLVREGAPTGTAVLASHQTAGRGRRGRTWWSPPGNVHLSYIYRPSATGAASVDVALAGLTLDVALAVLDVVDAFASASAAGLKWPNDVIAPDGRKLAGVLCELHHEGDAPAVVIGVGLNVAFADADVPLELAQRAVSLAGLAGAAPAVDAVTDALLDRLDARLTAFAARGRPDRDAFLARWAHRGARVRTSSGDEGLAVDLDPTGGLVLDTGAGPPVVVRSGEVDPARDALAKPSPTPRSDPE